LFGKPDRQIQWFIRHLGPYANTAVVDVNFPLLRMSLMAPVRFDYFSIPDHSFQISIDLDKFLRQQWRRKKWIGAFSGFDEMVVKIFVCASFQEMLQCAERK